MKCPYNDPVWDTCTACQFSNRMPFWYCCLEECGNHDFCKDCDKGIYLRSK